MQKDLNFNTYEWKQDKTHVFWGEIAPSDYIVQVYENDNVIVDSLERFVDKGFKSANAVIIIATPEHLNALNDRLRGQVFNLDRLRAINQYIPLDANEVLSKFMLNGWPDEALFMKAVKVIVDKAHGKSNRKVRAFGEMVSILWSAGKTEAAIHLEHLWNKFCKTESICLFCAYPKSGFTQDPETAIQHVCSCHTKMIAGFEKPKTEVFYKKLEQNKQGSLMLA